MSRRVQTLPGVRQFPAASDTVIEAYKKDIDRTLLRERLKLTPEERLRDLMRLQAAAEELRRAGRASPPRRSGVQTVRALRRLHKRLAGVPPLTDTFLKHAKNDGRR